jgi:hypothetical protein
VELCFEKAFRRGSRGGEARGEGRGKYSEAMYDINKWNFGYIFGCFYKCGSHEAKFIFEFLSLLFYE